MIRVLVLLVIALVVVASLIILATWSERRGDTRRVRHVTVLEDTIQEQARENYLLLDRTMDAIGEMLAQDELSPIFSARQRSRLVALRAEFQHNQLPRGETP